MESTEIRKENIKVRTQEVIIRKEDLYEPVFFQVGYLNQEPHAKQIEVLRSKCKNKVVVCGRRAGKSQMIGGEAIRGGITEEFKKQIVIAPTYKQAMIVMTKIVDLMYESGNECDLGKVIKSPNPRIEFINGSYIDFGSADNPDSLRGENYDRVFLDEAAFIKVGAIDAIRPLIYDTGAPIWFTTTPMGKGIVWDFWERGMSDDNDEYGCFNYCYLDNPYITDEGKKEIEKDIVEWGEESNFVQAEIFGKFVEDRDCYFKRSLVMECISDEHYTQEAHPKNRYIMGIDIAAEGEDVSVFYIIELPAYKDKGKVRTIEIRHLSVNKPRDVVGLAVELHQKYKFEKIYTDMTGIGEGPTDWIAEEIGDDSLVEGIRFSLQSKMDMYSNLKKLMNQGKLEIPNHKKLIHELCELRYERTSSGGMKIHHPDGGKVHDDFCFIAGSKVLTENGNINIEDLKIGNKVMTRKGYKKIKGIGNRNEKIIKRFGLSGTNEHPIITKNGIQTFNNVSALDKVYIWNEKQLSIEEGCIIDILNTKIGIDEYIIGELKDGKNLLQLCIEIFGKLNMEKFLKDGLSIIQMEILSIMILKILKLCQEENINLNIVNLKKEKKLLNKTWKSMQDLKLLNGISLKQGKNFINELERRLGKINNKQKSIVKNVMKNIKHIFQKEVDFVQVDASNEIGLKEEKVYNITVEDCNEYFVNNLLVHNCDALALSCLYLKEEESGEYESFIM